MNELFRWTIFLPVFLSAAMMCSAMIFAEQTRPANDVPDRTYWLANMAIHEFTAEEVSQVLGIPASETRSLLAENFKGLTSTIPAMEPGQIRMLPYPGGRHPRIGFLDGAIDPQRETKISLFAPWQNGGYVVLDFPEAVWHLVDGKPQLLYLAHTHVPTIWDQQKVTLPQLEWDRSRSGQLHLTRRLPNQVEMTSVAKVTEEGARFQFSITNHSPQALTGLRIQMCGMLKGLKGFDSQTNDNKIFQSPFVAAKNEVGNRWVILGFDHCVRAWGNQKCPCLHSDPQVPDCEPEQTQTVRGWLSFFEGSDVNPELQRLEKFAFQPIE